MVDYNSCVKTRSLYIHWPFCPYRCHFCPFVALASHDHFMLRYHDALMKEIAFFSQKASRVEVLDTIFLGGGTPSTYPNELLLDMFAKLKGMFDINEKTEVTIEVNPGTVNMQQLKLWKDLGINRLSIGVQSLNNVVLKMLNRLQSAQDVRKLIPQASGLFDNISVDLIIGLPNVTCVEWENLVKEIVAWPIQHISIYFLTVHENTRLYFDIQNKKVALPIDESLVKLYHWSVNVLKENGFEQYETSNFAKVGYQSRHNSACWQRKPYKGFGLGACSFDGSARFQNSKNLITYLENSEADQISTDFCEVLTTEQVHLEKVMLGLRRSCGVALKDLFEGLSVNQVSQVKEKIEWLKKKDYVKEVAGRVVLTSQALVVQNEVAVILSL
ncbi:radical SAM family heme chaperone HemW [bacterium]|nr:radical SAM family heme chaperone HemW [bacterium]